MRSWLPRWGYPVLLVLGLGPTVAAACLAGWEPFATVAATLDLLGRLAGVLALTLLLVAGLVSVRIPRTDQPFGGLTALWKAHHVLGLAAFLAAMAHPLLMALAAAERGPKAAAGVLAPAWGNRAAWLGWGGLLALTIFLAPTFSFFGPPKYQRWKGLHALSGLAVLLALAHTLRVGVVLPDGVWLLLGALTLLALAYRLIWRKIKPGTAYDLTNVQSMADRVVELTLRPHRQSQVFRYDPGQFVYLTPLDPQLGAGRGEEHPYTLTSAPDEPHLRIAVKDLGDASRALQTVAVGTRAYVDGPYGRFFEPGWSGPELWIGGGIGITPFVGQIRALARSPRPVDVHLVYCANDPTRAYYLDELQAAAAQVPGLHVWPHFFVQNGPLDARFLAAHVPQVPGRVVRACGPPPLMRVTHRLVKELGVPSRRYHSEEFAFL